MLTHPLIFRLSLAYALFRDGVEYTETQIFCKERDKCTQLDLGLMPDGLHPSANGYRLWGSEVKTRVEEIVWRD